MQCFVHDDQPAVGLCKSCQKGLCRKCAVDVGNGLACSGPCEEEVKNLNELKQREKAVYKKTGAAYKRNAFIYAAVGLIFVIWGLGAGLVWDKAGMLIFMLPAGLVFLLGAFLTNRSGKQIDSPDI